MIPVRASAQAKDPHPAGRDHSKVRGRPLQWFRALVAVSLAICLALFILWSWRWPLVGDAALIHYIAFLTHKGWAPYRDLGDMNMPGAFLVEAAAMRIFGAGDLAWRLFDFSLLAVAGLCFRVLTRREGWFPAWFAAALFALVHGQDGLAEGGQRDLTMAVFLLAATACLFQAIRRTSSASMLTFGLLAGVALTIKPTAALVSLPQFVIACWMLRKGTPEPAAPRPNLTRALTSAALGFSVGPLLALVWLLRHGAVAAFWHGLRTVVPYYASLGHRPPGWLILHSVSPLLALVGIWAAVLALARPRWNWERAMLGSGVLFGLASYVVQARGLPYYRYPVLAFLLPLMALDLSVAARNWNSPRSKAAATLALAGLAAGGLFYAPQSVLKLHRYRWWQTDFISSLQTNLERLGGPQLSGNVQCIDSIAGCGTTLYRMRLQPATGVLSDFLLFGPERAEAVRDARGMFQRGVAARPPEVVVVSSRLHLDGADHYTKLARWPWIETWLASNYRLETDWSPARRTRWWSQEETPASYRIYFRR